MIALAQAGFNLVSRALAMPAIVLSVSKRSRRLSIGEDVVVLLGVPESLPDLTGVLGVDFTSCLGEFWLTSFDAESVVVVNDEASFFWRMAFSSISSENMHQR